MTTSSIQRVYLRIRLDLQWSWIIFLVTDLGLAGLFFRILYTNLQDRTETWTHLFEQRIVQTEALLGEGARLPLPLSVSNLSFNDRGTILKAFPDISGLKSNVIFPMDPADAHLKDIPLAAVTASALLQDAERISGICDGYLSKHGNTIRTEY